MREMIISLYKPSLRLNHDGAIKALHRSDHREEMELLPPTSTSDRHEHAVTRETLEYFSSYSVIMEEVYIYSFSLNKCPQRNVGG